MTYEYMKMKKLDYIALILPVLLFVEVNVGGRLFLTELALLLCLALLSWKRELSSSRVKFLIVLLVIWLFAQVLTDIARATPFVDFVRGWSKIIFIGLDFIAILAIIQNNERRLMLFFIGLGIGTVLNESSSGLYADFATNWKMGVGMGTVIAALAFLSFYPRLSHKNYAVILIITISVFSFLNNARSLGGLLFVSALYLQFYSRIHHHEIIRLSVKKVTLVFGSALLLLTILSVGYGELVTKGVFGEEALYKYQSQNLKKFGPLGIIMGGRTELLVAGVAITDSPLIGHGSWAKDVKYKLLLMEIQSDLKDEDVKALDQYSSNFALIPSHSHILGAWVESGVVGGVFWGYVFLLIIKVLINIGSVNHLYRPVIVVLCMISLWDIIFSPLGGSRRIYWGGMFVLSIVILSSERIKKYNLGKRLT